MVLRSEHGSIRTDAMSLRTCSQYRRNNLAGMSRVAEFCEIDPCNQRFTLRRIVQEYDTMQTLPSSKIQMFVCDRYRYRSTH